MRMLALVVNFFGQQTDGTIRNRYHRVDELGYRPTSTGLGDRTETFVRGFLNRVRRFESYRGHQKVQLEWHAVSANDRRRLENFAFDRLRKHVGV